MARSATRFDGDTSVLPDHSIVVYNFQDDREYNPPHENPVDGFIRRNWEQRKEQGKTAEYAHTVEEFKKRVDVQGPGSGALPTPGSGA